LLHFVVDIDLADHTNFHGGLLLKQI
jgi:hypothetical protein